MPGRKSPAHLWPVDLECLPHEDAPFIFVTLGDLERERRALQAVLPARAGHGTPPLGMKEGVELGHLLQRHLRSGGLPPRDELAEMLSPLSLSESCRLDARLNQVGHALAHAGRVRGVDYSRTTIAAVSHRWDRRWVTLVAGLLLPAYLGHLSIDDFPAN